jgi:hypothetical protein
LVQPLVDAARVKRVLAVDERKRRPGQVNGIEAAGAAGRLGLESHWIAAKEIYAFYANYVDFTFYTKF